MAVAKKSSDVEQELAETFQTIITREDTMKVNFQSTLGNISDSRNKWRFLTGLSRLTREMGEKVGALAEGQIEVIENATDAQLAAWGVTREQAGAEMKVMELRKLGNVYRSSVIKRRNNSATTEKFWGTRWEQEFGKLFFPWPSVEFTRMCTKAAGHLSFDRGMKLVEDIMPRLQVEVKERINTLRTLKDKWIMVEDIKWLLQQDSLPAILPLSARKYHSSYTETMSVGGRLEPVSVTTILGTAEARDRAERIKKLEGIQERERTFSPALRSVKPINLVTPIVSARKVVAEKGKTTKSSRSSTSTKILKKRNCMERKKCRTKETAASQMIQVEPALNQDREPAVRDLLDDHRGDIYDAQDDTIKEDLEVADKVRDLLSSTEGSGECVSEARVARRIQMVLGEMQLMVVAIAAGSTPKKP